MHYTNDNFNTFLLLCKVEKCKYFIFSKMYFDKNERICQKTIITLQQAVSGAS